MKPALYNGLNQPFIVEPLLTIGRAIYVNGLLVPAAGSPIDFAWFANLAIGLPEFAGMLPDLTNSVQYYGAIYLDYLIFAKWHPTVIRVVVTAGQ